MIELLCTDYNKKATSIHYYLGNAVLLSMDDVKLEFTDDALHRISELAIKRKIGARGLRSIVEKALQKVMFDIPDMAEAKRVVVTDNVIDGTGNVIVYGARNKKIA